MGGLFLQPCSYDRHLIDRPRRLNYLAGNNAPNIPATLAGVKSSEEG